MIKSKEGFWVVVNESGDPICWTIRPYKGHAIDAYTNQNETEWGYYLKEGYRCIKVNIQFTEVK